MSNHAMGKSCVAGYESVWLNRWIRRDSAYGLKARSYRDAKCSMKTHLAEDDGQLWKESTGSIKLKEKTLNRSLHLFPNLDFRSKDKETDEDFTQNQSSTENYTLQTDKLPLAGGETSSSYTQEINVEHFVSNTSFPKECKRLRPSPTNCRSHVKRLKTNASVYSGSGTKRMMLVEGPTVEKMNYFFRRFLKHGTGRTQESSTSRNRNLYMGGGREDVKPLHPWIQRWCKKKSTETHKRRGGKQVNPKSFTLQKQFPGIAAMALMGKALRRFKPEWS